MFDVKNFDAQKAERDIKRAFYLVKDQMEVSEEAINRCVDAEVIRELQERRLARYDELVQLKRELQMRFRDYRVEGRIKSLTSLLGKHIQGRKLLDAFGLKIIVGSVSECYTMADWILKQYKFYEGKDRIAEPLPNGYRDLKLTVEYGDSYLEFIIQTKEMYLDARTVQAHNLKYPWKYEPVILGLPGEYAAIVF